MSFLQHGFDNVIGIVTVATATFFTVDVSSFGKCNDSNFYDEHVVHDDDDDNDDVIYS